MQNNSHLQTVNSSGQLDSNSLPPRNQDGEPAKKFAKKDNFYDDSKPSFSAQSETKSPVNSKMSLSSQIQNNKSSSQTNCAPGSNETTTADSVKIKTEHGLSNSDAALEDGKVISEVKKEEPDQMSSKDAIVSNSNQASSNSAAGNSTPDSKQGSISNSSILTPKFNQKDTVDLKPQTAPFSSITSQYSANKSNRPVQKKTFKPDELRQALMPVLEKLNIYNPESLPFRQPVDPEFLNIPDYFQIIKKPMDLSTIKRKLDTGQYSDPWQYVDDVWLMFENAWLYNKKNSKVYKFSTRLSEIFEGLIDPVMVSLGYCCGRKYVFQPQILLCFGKELCQIPRDAKYMNYKDR